MQQQKPLMLSVNGIEVGFTPLEKPQLVTRSKNRKFLEKASNPKKYRLLISKQVLHHFYHKFRTIFLDINSLDILISYNIKSKELTCTLYMKLGNFFYTCKLEPNQQALELIALELGKKDYSL